ncbi:MAG: hypothetical protein MUE68_10690 [Bacteroidetes bacterium]|nr:hypothetical protein [Bacteroidota bacterium]
MTIRGRIWVALILVSAAAQVSRAQSPVSLYNAFSGDYDYAVIGGTLRSQPNSVSSTALKTSDTTSLNIGGASVVAAYLYWAGSGATADNTVTFDGASYTADRTFSASYNNGGTMLYFFAAFKDITASFTPPSPTRAYIFSNLTVDNGGPYATSSAVVSGWSLLVVYNDAAGVRRTINIYDGFQEYRGSQIILQPNNFYVPFGTVDGKVTHVTFEGDAENSAALSGFTERLAFNGFELTDALNPTANQFNSVSNELDSAKGGTFGVDIDTYDITRLLTPGDTTATSLYSSGGDLVLLNLEVISISDTSNSDLQITKTHSGGTPVIAGNTMTYTLSVKNNGPDPTGAITVRDSLPAGAILSSLGLGSGWVVDSSLKPVYRFTRSAVLGVGATAPNISMTVGTKYDATSYPILRNVATVSSPQFDRRPWNNVSVDTVTIVTPVFVTSTKTFANLNGLPPVIGDTLAYTITVRNTGNYNVSPANLNPITVIDSVPSGFTILPGGLTPGASVSGQVITFGAITTLNVGATTTLTYRVRIGPSFNGNTAFTNIAHVRASTVDQVVTSTVRPPPPLSITKSFDPGKTKGGDVITVRLVVRNNSTSLTSTGGVVTDTLLTTTGYTYVANSIRLNGVLQTQANDFPTDSTRYIAGPPARIIVGLTGARAPGAADTITYQITALAAPRDIYNKAWVRNSQRSVDTSNAYVYIRANATGRVTGPLTILPGETPVFTLVDGDLNTNTGTVQTFNDSVFVVRTNEWEPIAFTETGVNTGVFTGSRASVFGTGSNGNNNGTLAVRPGDTLLVTYIDALDSSGAVNRVRSWRTAVVGGNTAILVGTTTALPGDSVYYTLTDADLNRNPSVVETYSIPDTNRVTNERETIVFTETGANTGIFTGKIATQFGLTAGANFNGSFNVKALDSLALRYRDTVNAAGQDGGWLSVRTNILGGATATLTVTPQIYPWDSVKVTVTDADLNLSPGVGESITVRDSNIVTLEYQDVVLTETGLNTGIFVGYLKTRYGLVRGADNDGYIFVQQGAQLRVSYLDARQANGGPGSTLTATTNVLGGNPGSLSASPTPIFAGDSVQVTITDADLNKNAALAESYAVRDSNITTGEWETITVVETGNNTGIFTTWVRTQYGLTAGTNNDGIFNAKVGDSLVVTYRDTVTTNGAPGATLKAGSGFKGGHNATLTATATILPGDSLQVTVSDRDLNRLPGVAESYTVRDTNRVTGEWETVTLTETGPNTGIFGGWLRSIFGTTVGANNSGSMTVKAGDTLRVTYRDSLRANGGALTLTANTVVRGGFTAMMTTTTPIVPGDSIRVLIKDLDLNKNAGVAESYTVRDTNRVTGEWETVTLTEASVNDSIFIGWIRTVYGAGAGSNNDGVFSVKASDSLVAYYRDTLLVNGGPGPTLTSFTRVLGGVTATFTASPSLLAPLDSTVLTLTDADLNKLSGTIEFYILSVVSKAGETENLRFVETGANTGVFTRVVGTLFGAGPGAAGDSVFTVSPGDTLRSSYIDSLMQDGGRQTLTVAVPILAVNFATSSKSLVDLNGGSVLPPDTLAYAIHVVNSGLPRARSVAVTDTLPSGVTVLSSTLPPGASVASGVLTFARFNLAAGDSVTLTYSVRVDSSIQSQVPAVNRARISANGATTVVTASFTPVNRPLMTFAKGVNRPTAKPGDTLTYTMTYSNTGTSLATMVIVTDGIPMYTTYVQQSVVLNGVPRTDQSGDDEVVVSGGVVQVAVGSVVPGGSGTITFRVRIQ